MPARDPNLVISSHSGRVTKDGVTVEVSIVRLENEPGWALEVVNPANTSVTWDELFDSDDDAMAAFWRAVEEEGMATFLDSATVIPFPRPGR